MIKNEGKGFTLIELLLVMAIISTLAIVLISIINPAEMGRRTRDSRRMSDLSTLKTAIDLAISDDYEMTATAPTGVVINDSTSLTDFAGMTGFDISKYISQVPQDPSYNVSGGNMQIIVFVSSACTKGSTTKDVISYKFWSDGTKYLLRSNMESLVGCDVTQKDGNPPNATYELGTESNFNIF